MRVKRDSFWLLEDERKREEAEVIEKLKTYLHQEMGILCYASFGSEFNTWGLMEWALQKKIRIYLPRLRGKEMDFFEVKDLKVLEQHSFGMEEPAAEGEPYEPCERDLILVPGLAFDQEGGRLGYGGGYYDRYLTKYPKPMTLGLSYTCQILEKIPLKEGDVRVKAVAVAKEGETA